MKDYQKPEIEVIYFSNIIRTDGEGGTGGEVGDGSENDWP